MTADMMSVREKTPQGIVGTLIDHEGHVRAEASDFGDGCFGGFSKWQSQRLQVRRRLARNFIDGHCYDVLAEAIDTGKAESIVNILSNTRGWRTHFIAVGYEGIDPNE